MTDWKAWVEGNEAHSLEWEKFLDTEAGRKGLEVLAHRLAEPRGTHPNATLIESKAIIGAEDDGYRTCMKYLNMLRFTNTNATKKQWEKVRSQGEIPTDLQGSALLGASQAVSRIKNDSIYKERETRMAELEKKLSEDKKA